MYRKILKALQLRVFGLAIGLGGEDDFETEIHRNNNEIEILNFSGVLMGFCALLLAIPVSTYIIIYYITSWSFMEKLLDKIFPEHIEYKIEDLIKKYGLIKIDLSTSDMYIITKFYLMGLKFRLKHESDEGQVKELQQLIGEAENKLKRLYKNKLIVHLAKIE